MNLENMVFLNVYMRKERKKERKTKHITHRKERYKTKIKLKIEVSSLTCLFVYKVLNQEVLDDRGKFEVSL